MNVLNDGGRREGERREGGREGEMGNGPIGELDNGC